MLQMSPIECRRGGETCSLSDENLLLSGTVLKNTGEAVGVCVYRAGLKKLAHRLREFFWQVVGNSRNNISPNLGPTF